MNITDVNLFVNNNSSSSAGYGSITFNDFFRVSIMIKKSHDGSLFIGWPGNMRKDTEGNAKWFSSVSFVNVSNPELAKNSKKEIDDYILSEFNKKLAIQGKGSVSVTTPVKSGVSIKTKAKEDTPPFDVQGLYDEDERIFQEELMRKA